MKSAHMALCQPMDVPGGAFSSSPAPPATDAPLRSIPGAELLPFRGPAAPVCVQLLRG